MMYDSGMSALWALHEGYLWTKHQWKNANTQNANQNANTKILTQPQNPNPQTQKSVAFHTLAFYLWHSDTHSA